MSYEYTITDLATKANVSLQSCYGLIKKNREFIDNNSVRRHRKIYYNQAVMDFFIAYYQPDETPEINPNTINQNTAEIRAPEGEQKSPVEAPQTDKPPEGQLNALQSKIDALEAEIEALRKQLDASETEKKELLRQNGEVLLLLQMEKQEKQLFLPAPKKSFSERIKSLFRL